MRNTPNRESLPKSVVFSASLLGSRELITELGGDPEAVWRAADVPAAAFEAPDIYIDAQCLVDYLELAADVCDCPEFGLLHGSRVPMGSHWGQQQLALFGYWLRARSTIRSG